MRCKCIHYLNNHKVDTCTYVTGVCGQPFTFVYGIACIIYVTPI